MADNYLERQYADWLEKKARRSRQALKKKSKTKFWTRPGKAPEGGEPEAQSL